VVTPVKVLTLDIDGVLADTAAAYAQMDPGVDPWQWPLWAANIPPVPVAHRAGLDVAVRLWRERGGIIQIVTGRRPSLATVTIDWLHRHYPYLLPLAGFTCTGGDEDKSARGAYVPLVAVDDSPQAIAAYRRAGIPVCAVESVHAPWAEAQHAMVQRDPGVSLHPTVATAMFHACRLCQ
jgi:phosphoglycolate phosphatase-like HAD superfamily hydrolase